MSLCVAMSCAQTVRGGGEGAPTMVKAASMRSTVARARSMLQSCLKLCFASDTASGSEDVNALLMQHGAASAVAGGMGRRRSSAMALQAAAGGNLPSDDEGGSVGPPRSTSGRPASPRGSRVGGAGSALSPSGLRRPESFERNLRRYTSFAQAVLTSRRMPSFSMGSVANILESRHKAGMDSDGAGGVKASSGASSPLDIGGLVDQEVDDKGNVTAGATGLSTLAEVSEATATPEVRGRSLDD